MSKEKQIKEITRIIFMYDSVNSTDEDVVRCAKHLYNAGYRKQSEVIDDFVKRLLDAFPEAGRNNHCPAIYYDDYRYIIEELAERMKGESK